ncbi:GCS-domain-containing protein [Nadsonia fulvescens var. elongata DSM 6958]|uniref:glutamate--cysteine ligase n=1 Tax=Nadsonia fulvescens var. elongata DSM 6958 TaxID=857566 RepID=A0A1E3PCG0_9ASCO|nr:GCS-domain-containing protein [Nadsonia fulvescens var. elongata DSM 6958]
MSARRVSRSRSSAQQAQSVEPVIPSSSSPSSPAAAGSSPVSSAEITRCICGHDELHFPDRRHFSAYLPVNSPFLTNPDTIDSGLFIQCETCDVWQHGFCVGFYQESSVPDVYFCEKCRPDLHVVVVRPSGKTSTYVGSEDNRENIEMVLKHGASASAEEDNEIPENSKGEANQRKPKVTSRNMESNEDLNKLDNLSPADNIEDSQIKDKSTNDTIDSVNHSPAPNIPLRSPNADKSSHLMVEHLKHENSEDENKNPTISNASGRSSRSLRSTLNSRSGDAAYEETLRRVLEESVNDKKHISDESDGKHNELRKSKPSESVSNIARKSGDSELAGKPNDELRRDGDPALSSSSSSSRSSRSKKRQVSNNYASYDEDTNTNEAVTNSNNDRSLPVKSKRKRRVMNEPVNNQELTGDEDTPNNTDTGHGSFKTTAPKRRRQDDTSNATTTNNNNPITSVTPTSSKGGSSKGGSRSSKSKPEDYVNDKPSKPRIPGSRSQLNDMKRRVAAILEFIGRTQVEMAQENSDESKRSPFGPTESTSTDITTRINSIDESLMDEQSIQNPSESDAQSTYLFESSKSLQMMDGLTRKLLLWEQKFGRSVGTPLHWDDAKKHADYVREQGIVQLMNIYNKTKKIKSTQLLWGDEVEYMVISYDDDHKQANLSLRQAEILDTLAHAEACGELDGSNVTYHPEYGRFMLEATPANPYTGEPSDLITVESNMVTRRKIAKRHMKDTEVPLTITSFPRLGVQGQFTDPYFSVDGAASKSLFLPDQIINTHARFPTLTANIRRRRGEKVAMNIPIFKDTDTPSPFIDPDVPKLAERGLFGDNDKEALTAAKPDHIYLDSMGFGMGCCCLQITFQARDISEGRDLYDSLAPLTPILMALTAGSPTYRGYLADQDTRWNVISGAVDDRTPYERNLSDENPTGKQQRIPKSRYDSIDCYISTRVYNNGEAKMNDIPIVQNDTIREKLKQNSDMDDLLSQHFSHLFIRDPLSIFEELLEQDNENSSDHFENIQSTNWQTMRFKPPPPNSPIGWRVEFRSMEVQLTDFENAAFSVFTVLLTRIIISYNLNLYMPLSMVDANMKTAHKRNAVIDEKFYFRSNLANDDESIASVSFNQLSVDEIINGSANKFIGLVPLIKQYLHSISVPVDTLCQLERYLSLISRRASGELVTTATWIRNFITNHVAYKHDSVISSEINYDLCKLMEEISNGKKWNDADGAKTLLNGFKPNYS